MLKNIVLVAMLMSVATIALAQNVRERGDKACRRDTQRLCKTVIDQGDMAILSCLQANQNKLSGNCSKFLKEVGQLD